MAERVVNLTLNDENNDWSAYTIIRLHLKQYYGIKIEELTNDELSKIFFNIIGFAFLSSHDNNVVDDVMKDLGYIQIAEGGCIN